MSINSVYYSKLSSPVQALISVRACRVQMNKGDLKYPSQDKYEQIAKVVCLKVNQALNGEKGALHAEIYKAVKDLKGSYNSEEIKLLQLDQMAKTEGATRKKGKELLASPESTTEASTLSTPLLSSRKDS